MTADDRAWFYELSRKFIREVEEKLEQYDVEVQRRGRVSLDEIYQEIKEAEGRLRKAKKRRDLCLLRAHLRSERERAT